ncbi:MAG: tail fiber domain-containing protein [Flavobacteriales bacterium]|nr:tail fiber domain-containing protein [Flavobacteriales bacterium]
MKKRIVWGIAAAIACTQLNLHGQDWNTAGNLGLPGTSFLGTTDGIPINFRTNNILRMRLTESLTGQVIGSYINENLSGNLGIGAFTSGNVQRPFSLLHLDNGGTQFSGYRPWFRPGMTITNGSDLGWIGLKNEGGDLNHLTLAWADNTAMDGPDLFKIVFLANPGTMGTAGSLDGLETMRIRPVPGGIESYFGIGDWFTTGSNGNPTERLDVLDGRVRIRQLPQDLGNDSLTKIMVVDDTDPTSPEYGVVKWRDASSLGSSCSSGWSLMGNNAVTAYNGNPCPPQATNNVGIGTMNPFSKLDIYKEVNSGTPIDIGLSVRMGTTALNNLGGYANLVSPTVNVGWRGDVRKGTRNWALDGNAAYNSLDSTVLWSGVKVVGVRGFADGNFMVNTSNIRGVWGIARRPQPGGWGYGGWFDGYTYCSLNIWGPSDAQLKENVMPLEGAMDKLLQLRPKSYTYKASEFPTMGLDDAVHFGVIAQELEEVFPELVRDGEQPAAVDSLGNEIASAVQFKMVNQDGLLPWVIAGMQEQQATIDQLRSQINQCCAANGSGMAPSNGEQRSSSVESNVQEQRLLIIPNPVADLTTLAYYVPTAGQVSLQVSTSDGKPVATLREELAEAGAYNYAWNTTKLAAGTYFCTFMLDGAVVVKRAVKVK